MNTEYWVVFPQGIEQEWENKKLKLHGTTYKRMLVAKTMKSEWKLMKDYNGAYFETIVDNGKERKAINWFTWETFDNDIQITQEKLWDMWKKEDKIILPKEAR